MLLVPRSDPLHEGPADAEDRWVDRRLQLLSASRLCLREMAHNVLVYGLMCNSKYEEFLSVEWKPNYERGCSFYFGYKAIKRFLDDNELLCLVRAHQVRIINDW